MNTTELKDRLEELRDKQAEYQELLDELAELEGQVNEKQDEINKLELDIEPEELEELESLEADVEGWNDGVDLIPESEFPDYVKQMLEDTGELPKELPWYVSNHIDWEGVADDISTDYSQVEYKGETYYYRP